MVDDVPASHPHPPDALPVGASIGGYLIESVLGQGGFGITYKALNPVTGRRVAIKEFFPQGLARRGGSLRMEFTTAKADIADWAINRFRTTTTTLCGLSHDNIIKVIDYVPANATGYMIMELLEGRTLSDWLGARAAPPTLEDLRPIIDPIMAALVYVHGKGLIHRDVAPDNILVAQDGRPVLIDFGSVSRELSEQGRGSTVSTFKAHYTAPEFMGPRATPDISADVYSLGAVLYMAATGHEPVDSRDRMGASAFGAGPDPLIPLSGLKMKGWPPRAANAVDEALSLDKRKRPASVEILRRAFQPEGVTALVPETASKPASEPSPIPPAGKADAAASRRSTGKLVAALCLAGLAFGAAAYGLSRVLVQRDVGSVASSDGGSPPERPAVTGGGAPSPAAPSTQPSAEEKSASPSKPQPATPPNSSQQARPAASDGSPGANQNDAAPRKLEPAPPPDEPAQKPPAATAQIDPPADPNPKAPPGGDSPERQTKNAPTPAKTAAPVVPPNRASFWETTGTGQDARTLGGKVAWRLEPGAARSSAKLVGEVALDSIYRNATITLSREMSFPGAGLSIDLRFAASAYDQTFAIRSVRALGTYWDGGAKYATLLQRSARLDGGGVRIELSREESARETNERLLREGQSIAINFAFKDGREAALTLDIGDQRDLFAKAFDSWRDAALTVDEPAAEKRAEAPASGAAAPAPRDLTTPNRVPPQQAAPSTRPAEKTPAPAEPERRVAALVEEASGQKPGRALKGSVAWTAYKDDRAKAKALGTVRFTDSDLTATIILAQDEGADRMRRLSISLDVAGKPSPLRIASLQRLGTTRDDGARYEPLSVRSSALQGDWFFIRLANDESDRAQFERLIRSKDLLQANVVYEDGRTAELTLDIGEDRKVFAETFDAWREAAAAAAEAALAAASRSPENAPSPPAPNTRTAAAAEPPSAPKQAPPAPVVVAPPNPPKPIVTPDPRPAVKTAVEPVAKPPVVAAPTAITGAGYWAQLAARFSAADARQISAELQSRHSAALGGRSPVIQKATAGDGTVVYRVRIGPFGDRADASTVCARVKAGGGDCYVPGDEAAAQAVSAPKPTTGGTYWVQVTSKPSEAEARSDFADLQRRHSALLGDRRPSIQIADIDGKGRYYRVRVGPFASSEDASGLCGALRTRGAECVIAR